MAWQATFLLFCFLLVLLAPGSWAQDREVLQRMEGQTVFVTCQYGSSQRWKEKVWCQKTSAETCKILVSSVNTGAAGLRYTIQDHPESHFFTVKMTALKRSDSGTYYCAIAENRRTDSTFVRITTLRAIRLSVAKDNSSIPTSVMIPTWTVSEVPTSRTTKDQSTTAARLSTSNIIILMVCGLFSKTLIFTVLFVVTQRSYG
ncbi:natural cytotoxicity triggering receptor 2-like [Meriones unguiculatus]|uniref:natural cytotoxicity triggering receptor 2-like n=1 Tax=Meriones unguiculatus TaxID=10047 RepID=UPI00293E597B|nr:natural cytotoxicity triggering receptor 2-like [Meriones unguiculatus]